MNFTNQHQMGERQIIMYNMNSEISGNCIIFTAVVHHDSPMITLDVIPASCHSESLRAAGIQPNPLPCQHGGEYTSTTGRKAIHHAGLGSREGTMCQVGCY